MDKNNIKIKIDNILLKKKNVLHKPKIENYYQNFQIPKKRGGFREILAPSKELKALQHYVSFAISSMFNFKCDYYFLSDCSYSMIGVKQNAEKHKNSNYFLTMDISKFYPSLTTKIIRDVLFEKLKKINRLILTNDEDRDLKSKFNSLIYLSSYKGCMATGSPATPIISELFMMDFDKKIEDKLKKYLGDDVIYTRYVDDITISSKTNIPPTTIQLVKNMLFKERHLIINNEKTKLYAKNNYRVKKDITGVTITYENNMSCGRKYIEHLKSEIYDFEKEINKLPRVLIASTKVDILTEKEFIDFITDKSKTKGQLLVYYKEIQKIQGKINWLKFINPESKLLLDKKYGVDIEKTFNSYLKEITKQIKNLKWSFNLKTKKSGVRKSGVVFPAI